MVDYEVDSCAAVKLNTINTNHEIVNSVALCEGYEVYQEWKVVF